MKKMLFITLISITLIGCTAQSPYRAAKGSGYGFQEKELSQHHYQVQYKTAQSNVKKAQDFALLRAAELTIEQGYDWFIVSQRDTNTDREKNAPLSHPSDALKRECGLLTCRTRIESTNAFDTDYEWEKDITIILNINLGRGLRPATNTTQGDKISYDARETASSLRRKLNL